MNVFKKIFGWFSRHWPTKRRIIQVYTALLFNCNIKGFVKGRIYTGNTKYLCTPGLNCYSCPGAVTACPMGALQNAFASSATRTPYYILGILGLLGLMFARTICGFLCPVGLGQDLLYKIKTPKIKKSKYTRALSYVKYVILVVFAFLIPLMYGIVQSSAVPGFCKYICPAGTLGGGIGLLVNPANTDYFAMLGPLFTWKFALLVAIIVFCAFIYRPFCRFLCPLGAIYGFFNKIAIIGVKLDKQKCTDCGLCVSHCKMDIKHVGDHECINCGECISVCPVKAISWKGSKLFLKANAYNEQTVTEEKPLTPLLATASASEMPSENALSNNIVTESVTNENPSIYSENIENDETPFDEANVAADNDSPQDPIDTNAENREQKDKTPKTKKGRNFYLQLGAFCLAFVVLFGAILYYNVILKYDNINALSEGDVAPEFSLQTYGYDNSGKYALLDDTFDFSEHLDQIVVINFWATWCGPCTQELPDFDRIQKEYPEICVVAVHTTAITVPSVADWVVNDKPAFTSFDVTFLQDKVIADENSPYNGQTIFETFGGKDALPVTVIVVKGLIKKINNGSMPYETLKSVIESYV